MLLPAKPLIQQCLTLCCISSISILFSYI
ncbi:hypothetical protein EMERY_97 [Brevibacillus phage Emery]|nr:hypothetical protein EMERY_97 [Brevibacillus phage Emery]